MVLVAGGFLELPQRSQAQTPSPLTPTLKFLKQFGAAKEELTKLAESDPPDRWEAERKEYVRGQLQWAVDLYAKLS